MRDARCGARVSRPGLRIPRHKMRDARFGAREASYGLSSHTSRHSRLVRAVTKHILATDETRIEHGSE